MLCCILFIRFVTFHYCQHWNGAWSRRTLFILEILRASFRRCKFLPPFYLLHHHRNFEPLHKATTYSYLRLATFSISLSWTLVQHVLIVPRLYLSGCQAQKWIRVVSRLSSFPILFPVFLGDDTWVVKKLYSVLRWRRLLDRPDCWSEPRLSLQCRLFLSSSFPLFYINFVLFPIDSPGWLTGGIGPYVCVKLTRCQRFPPWFILVRTDYHSTVPNERKRNFTFSSYPLLIPFHFPCVPTRQLSGRGL